MLHQVLEPRLAVEERERAPVVGPVLERVECSFELGEEREDLPVLDLELRGRAVRGRAADALVGRKHVGLFVGDVLPQSLCEGFEGPSCARGIAVEDGDLVLVERLIQSRVDLHHPLLERPDHESEDSPAAGLWPILRTAMRRLLDFAGLVDRLNQRISRVVAWGILLMVLLGAYNAIARSLERRVGLPLSSNSLLELQWYLFGIGFLLAAPYALRRGDHVRVDVVYDGLPRRGRTWIDLLGGLLLLLPFCAFGVVLSLRFVSDSIAQNEWSNDPGGLPRWPIKLFVPVGFVLLGLQGIASVIRNVDALRAHGEPAAEDVHGQ